MTSLNEVREKLAQYGLKLRGRLSDQPRSRRRRECRSCRQSPASCASLRRVLTVRMSFMFHLLATDGRARRGRLDTPHGAVETPDLHARRHAGHGQGPDARPARGRRRPDHPRQHLPPGPAARRRADRRAGRPAPLHGLGPARSSPTPAASRSSASPTSRKITDARRPSFRSHIDGALLELTPERAVAHPGEPRLRHRHVPRRVPAGRRRPSRSCATPSGGRSSGPSAARRPTRRPDQALFAIVQGGTDLGLRDASAPSALVGAGLPRLRPGRLQRRRDRRTRCSPPCRPSAALLPADKPRYLMGVGRPDDLLAGVAAGHRHVRLRDADAQRPQRPRPSPPTARSGCGTPATSEIRPRSSPIAPATPAGTSAGRTCTTCSRRTRCSGRRCCRCTTSRTTCG